MKRLLVQNGQNVRITGGEFSYNDTGGYIIAVRHSAGTTMLDGISINANGREADAISTYGHTGRMIVQNVFVRGVKGSSGGAVRDVIEAAGAGPLAELTLQNVTALTAGRGLFSPYNSRNGRGAIKLVLDRVNARYDTSLPKWTSSTRAPKLLHLGDPTNTEQQPPPDGITLSNVYVDGAYWGLPYQKTVYLNPEPQPDGCAFFGSDRFAGKVCTPSPPGGLDYAPVESLGKNYNRAHFCGQEASSLTVQKRWFASSATADYTAHSPTNSAFFAAQTPWGHWDMGANDVFRAEASTNSSGFLRNRIVTGPLRVGSNLPKGAPNVTFGDHFDLRPTIRPLGNGVWSNTISELKVSVGGTATASSTGAYARAIQIHGFRTAYTGSAWQDVSSTDGDTYDIQIRYKTGGSFPLYGGGSDVFRERKKIGDHTWDIYRTEGGWASDLGMGFVLTENVESISNVDVKAILDYALSDANARYSRNDSGIYIRGVQAWVEPISGTLDATIEGMTVSYNGNTYGVLDSN